MDRFQAMRVFVQIIDRNSFTLAAQDLRMPRATVSYAIKQLEAHLGVTLLNRTTRHVSPTPDGSAYYQRCLQILADVEDAEGAFRDATPKGLLRVDIQSTLACHCIIPALPSFFERFPEIELHLSTREQLIDPVEEGVDCVLRTAELADSSLIMRRLTMLEEVTCASPDYLHSHGIPQTPSALQDHKAVNFFSSSTGTVVPLEFTEGDKVVEVPVKGSLSVTGAESYIAAAKAGLGLIQLPRYAVANALHAGELVEVLATFPPPKLPLSLLYAPRYQLSTRLRAFADWVSGIVKTTSI